MRRGMRQAGGFGFRAFGFSDLLLKPFNLLDRFFLPRFISLILLLGELFF